jgi:precorrin-6B methylase 2
MTPSGDAGSVRVELVTEDDDAVTLELEDDDAARVTTEAVLRGELHPALPFVDDVDVVVDVAAASGATTVLFARRHPGAQVHALEPDPETRARLVRNVAGLDRVHVHAIDPVGGLRAWVADQGLERIDVLNVEGDAAEESLLASITDLLPAIRVLYLEYRSRAARRAEARLLGSTHELYRSIAFLDHGRSIYLRRDLADHPDAARRLLELFVENAQTQTRR